MDFKILLENLLPSNFPVGLGGCQNDGTSFECCEYNITIFDGKLEDVSIHEADDDVIKLHHGSLSETNSGILMQYKDMKILEDEQWHLRMFLSKIKEKDKQISNSFTQECLVDTGVYATMAKDRIKASDPLASVWLKCAAYSLADAIFSINFKRPSPTHMLQIIRGFEKNKINETFSIVHSCLGIERASTSLLSRMVKSTIGFSDMVEKNGHSKIIQKKYGYLVKNSLLADCYFYLGYTNRTNVIKIKDKMHRNPEYPHILKVALDTESGPIMIENQAKNLLKTANELLVNIKN